MKRLVNTILSGAALGFGYLLGVKAFNKLSNPVVRKGIKTKFINVKDAMFKKEES